MDVSRGFKVHDHTPILAHRISEGGVVAADRNVILRLKATVQVGDRVMGATRFGGYSTAVNIDTR